MTPKKSQSRKSRARQQLKEPDFFLKNPIDAARHLDALLYFIHKRYTNSGSNLVPDLGAFLITRADVIFSNQVSHVIIEKRPSLRTLQIMTPLVPEKDEESRRIFLLNEFGELILKYQKQAYLQIRDMLLRITEPAGRDALVEEFESYKLSLK